MAQYVYSLWVVTAVAAIVLVIGLVFVAGYVFVAGIGDPGLSVFPGIINPGQFPVIIQILSSRAQRSLTLS